MKWAARLRADLRQGKNWEYYITIPAALLIGVLSLFGLGQAYTLPLTLAVLAILAGGMLGNRHQVEELAAKLDQTISNVFLEKFPAILDRDIEAGRQVWLVGVTLSTPLNVHYALLRKKLQRGDTINVLLITPDTPAVDLAEMRGFARTDTQRTNHTLRAHLGDYCELRASAPDHMRIKTIAHPLGHGLVAVDPDTPKGVLYISNYPFKTEGGALPKFMLRPSDGRWYSLYREELQNLWEAAQDWPCPE